MLTVKNVTKQFGGLTALNNVSFTVEEGQITALIGPNGSGKTTMFNLITGAFQPTNGEILFRNKPIHHQTMDSIVRQGIARTFQLIRLFKNLSVLENVMLGLHLQGETGFWNAVMGSARVKSENERIKEEAYQILKQFHLESISHLCAGDLPAGQGRLVEIARALGTNPQLLLLDEPAAGLNPEETEHLGDRLKELVNQGRTILIVEHDMGLVMKLAQNIIVLSSGQHLASGTPKQIQNNREVINVYLGRSESHFQSEVV